MLRSGVGGRQRRREAPALYIPFRLLETLSYSLPRVRAFEWSIGVNTLVCHEKLLAKSEFKSICPVFFPIGSQSFCFAFFFFAIANSLEVSSIFNEFLKI